MGKPRDVMMGIKNKKEDEIFRWELSYVYI
jgi:hypothetical protein